MKNLAIWIVLLCTAAFGVALAQPNSERALKPFVSLETTA